MQSRRRSASLTRLSWTDRINCIPAHFLESVSIGWLMRLAKIRASTLSALLSCSPTAHVAHERAAIQSSSVKEPDFLASAIRSRHVFMGGLPPRYFDQARTGTR